MKKIQPDIDEIWGDKDRTSFPTNNISKAINHYVKLDYKVYKVKNFDSLTIFYLKNNIYPSKLQIREHSDASVSPSYNIGFTVGNIIFKDPLKYKNYIDILLKNNIEIFDDGGSLVVSEFPIEVFVSDPDGYVTSISLLENVNVAYYN